MQRRIMATFLGVAAICVTAAQAQEKHVFMKITVPQDGHVYAPADMAKITGVLQLPGKSDVGSLFLRFRVFAPRTPSFVIAQETLSEVSRLPVEKALVRFETTLKLPEGPGSYLLRVDCLDRRVKQYPDSLVATQSLFIELRAKAEGNTLSINSPQNSSKYTTTSDIAVAGYTTSGSVVKVRLRFFKNNTVVQETIVDVQQTKELVRSSQSAHWRLAGGIAGNQCAGPR